MLLDSQLETTTTYFVSEIMAYRLDGVADASLLCIACWVYTDCIVSRTKVKYVNEYRV